MVPFLKAGGTCPLLCENFCDVYFDALLGGGVGAGPLFCSNLGAVIRPQALCPMGSVPKASDIPLALGDLGM